MTPPAATRSPVKPTWILLVAGIHLVSACWHVLFGGQNIDEGFYALAARSVWQGDLPYRDFGYTQMPLLPYINGLVMQLTGFGLFEQRAINALWGALTLLLAARWLARRTSPAWALGFALLLSLSTQWMYFIQLGKTYAFTGLMVASALWVFTEWPAGWRKASLLALLGTLGTGCRLPAAPFFAVLWLFALAEPGPAGRHWLRAILSSLPWPLLLLLPFYLADFEAARFWTLDLQRIAVAARAWPRSWFNVLNLAPALWLGLSVSLILMAKAAPRISRNEVALIVATLFVLAANLLPDGAYLEYAVPFLPMLALVVAVGLWRTAAPLRPVWHAAIPVGLLLLNAGINLGLLWPAMSPARRGSLSAFLPAEAPDYNPALPASLARARQAVRNYLPADRPFVGPHLILAVEAGRSVPRTLRMGAFTATADYPAAQARRLNLATFPELDAYFNDPTVPLLALTKNASLNYAWSAPTFHRPPGHNGARWLAILQRDFVVAYEDGEFFILVRKPRAGPSRPDGAAPAPGGGS